MNSALRIGTKLFRKGNCLPEVITAFVTHRCNADCSFCCFRSALNVPVPELDRQEWSKIAASIGPFKLLILTGGEPFLRHDLADIAASFAATGVSNISVPTNGSRPEKIADFAERVLSRSNLESLCISLSVDALGEKHDEIRGVANCFGLITRSVECLQALKKHFGQRLLIHTATVFSAQTQDTVEETLSSIRKVFKPDSMGLTLARRPAGEEHRKNLDSGLYLRLNQALAADSVSARYSMIGAKLHRAKSNRVVREQVYNEYVSPCYAGAINAVIYADGTVPLCETRNEIIGNLREFDLNFRALWSSERKRELFRLQQEERCRCGHECYVTPNIGFNPKQLIAALAPFRQPNS